MYCTWDDAILSFAVKLFLDSCEQISPYLRQGTMTDQIKETATIWQGEFSESCCGYLEEYGRGITYRHINDSTTTTLLKSHHKPEVCCPMVPNLKAAQELGDCPCQVAHSFGASFGHLCCYYIFFSLVLTMCLGLCESLLGDLAHLRVSLSSAYSLCL